MSLENIQKLVESYSAWLRDKTALRPVGEWVEITTPYLDRHNDYLQIYARPEADGTYLLSDDGYILDDLEMSGCPLGTPKRKQLLASTLNGFGIKQAKNGALETRATKDNFPLRKHNLLQAMMAVNDMFYLSSPVVESLFFEDVLAWLDQNRVRYVRNVKFTGKSGYDHLFDFVIPKSELQPERIVQAVSRPDRNSAQAICFAWEETKDIRPLDSRAYAILNDTNFKVPTHVLDAFASYDVHPVLWKERDRIREELSS